MPLKRSDNFPDSLKPFRFHGVALTIPNGSNQAVGDCPLCGRDGKFYVAIKTGLWDCKRCSAAGNVQQFLEQLYTSSLESDREQYSAFAQDRGLLHVATLIQWGVARSAGTGDLILPGYDADGKLVQLYKYVELRSENRRALLATPGQPHGLYGVPLFDPKKPDVYLCEGPWDAMALWEILREVKYGMSNSGQLVPTSNAGVSLSATANVLATPSCSVFRREWLPLFVGKRVFLCYDNDHARKHPKTGADLPPAGWVGMKKTAELLASAEEPPSEIHCLYWGEQGVDPELPDGYDVRDSLKRGLSVSTRKHFLGEILDSLKPIPSDWVAGRTPQARKNGGTELECLPCKEWKVLQQSWKKAMRWTDGLDRTLSFMLACVTSTMAVGDQLWGMVIGPPACGKSTLCEALGVAKEYVVSKSTIRGFYSGWKSDKEGKEDNSLISKLRGKTLVTKDGDTLLQAENLGLILAQARDLYDSTSRSHYNNQMGRDYEGLRMTWLLCGTPALYQLDTSELGERFLDCIIMEGIDPELEDDILTRVANRAERNLSSEANGYMDTHYDVDLVQAMQLTGGYVCYLRRNAQSLLSRVTMEDDALRQCISLGKFVAYMRARPSSKQEETSERELAARLVSQLVRLAKCTAVVLNHSEVDEEVMRRVTRIALDTARGRSFEIAKLLYAASQDETNSGGLETRSIALRTNHPEEKERNLLKFMARIGAVELFQHQVARGMSLRPRWRLTSVMQHLYGEVMGYREAFTRGSSDLPVAPSSVPVTAGDR